MSLMEFTEAQKKEVDNLNKAIKITKSGGESSDLKKQLGALYLSIGDCTTAESYLNQAIDENSDNAEAIHARGYLKICRGDYLDAIADARLAQKLDSEIPSDNLNVAKQLSQTELVLNNLSEEISSANSKLAELHNTRGVNYLSLGKYDEAMADFEVAVGLCPEYSDAYNNRGFLKLNLGQLKEAEADCEKALELNPFCPENNINAIRAQIASSNN